VTAQELMDRHAECFAGDVVERNVDGALGSSQDTAALEILGTVQFLPDATHLHRILADEEGAEVVNGAHHRQLAAA